MSEKVDVLRFIVEEMEFTKVDELANELESLAVKMLSHCFRDKIINETNWDLEKGKIDGTMPSNIDWVTNIEFRNKKYEAHLRLSKIEKYEADFRSIPTLSPLRKVWDNEKDEKVWDDISNR